MFIFALRCRPSILRVVVLLFLSLAAPVSSQKPTGHFVNPPEWTGDPEDPSNNVVYKVGDTIHISWSSNTSAPLNLAIAQTVGNDTDKGIGNIQYLPGSTTPVGSSAFSWVVKTDGKDGEPELDLTRGNVFRLELLVAGTSDSDFAWSTWFNLTSSSVSRTGSVTSSAAGQSSSTSPPASATKGSATTETSSSSSTSPPTTVSASNLVAATKISIGVGVGIGVPLLLAVVVGGYIILKRWGDNGRARVLYEEAERRREKIDPHSPGMLCSQCQSLVPGRHYELAECSQKLHELAGGPQKPQELSERALDPHELGIGTLR